MNGQLITINGQLSPFTDILRELQLEFDLSKPKNPLCQIYKPVCDCNPKIRGELFTAELRAAHLERVHAIYSCSQCSHAMKIPGALKNHYGNKHGKTVVGFKCPYACRKDNLNPSSMNRHVARKHCDFIISTECWDPDCHATFIKDDDLKAHFAREHEEWQGGASVIEVVTDEIQLKDFNDKHADAY